MTTVRNKYLGITHPLCKEPILEHEEFIESWRITNCANGMHLFDEVWSDDAHYLHCDICEMEVHIKEIVIPDGKDKVIE